MLIDIISANSMSWIIFKAHTHTHTCIRTCTDKNAHSQLWRDISMTLWRILDTVQRRGTRSSRCLFSDQLCIGRLVSSRWQPWIEKHLECHFFWFKKTVSYFVRIHVLAKHFVLVSDTDTLKDNVQKSNFVLHLAFCHPVSTWKEDI